MCRNSLKMCSFGYISVIFMLNFLTFGYAVDIMMNMIRKGNYPAEKHTVETKDGFMLSLYRIPRMDETQENGKVILLMHGFADSAEAFLELRDQKSTARELYKNGYDVWMLNARGNVFSQKHMRFNASDPRFWNFSFHEIGVYDLPATIDYILEKTNQTKLAYVGVSQGVAVLLVTLSEFPEYNDKITVANMMAPAVIFKHLSTYQAIMPRSMELIKLIETFLQSMKVYNAVPHSIAGIVRNVAPLCRTPFGSNICRQLFIMLFGPSNQYFDMQLSHIVNHYPSGSSYKQLIHYLQMMVTGKFQKYHHDERKNMKMYGSNVPPEYDLSKITTDIHILYGSNDNLASARNIPLLVNKLQSSNVTLSKFTGYNHIDFNYGRNFKKLHKKLFQSLNQYYDKPSNQLDSN